MTNYDIQIDYRTGDSFGSDDRVELLGIITSDLDKAKENLRRIKEHYLRHKDSANYGEDYELTLLTDSGERKIWPFWIGYFERLYGAEIVIDTSELESFRIEDID